MFDTYAASARALDAWHEEGRNGPRPPGHLRTLPHQGPDAGPVEGPVVAAILERLHDPDGRPAPLQRRKDY